MTQSFFPLLGIRPGAGRFFTTAEDGVAAAGGAAAPVVVLGHAFWRNQFAADPHVLGREVRLGDAVYTDFGVTPKYFNGVDLGRVDVWLPLGERPEWRADRGNYGAVNVIARLKAGVGVAAAEREANTVNMAGYARDGVKQETEAMALGPLQRGRGPSKPLEVRVAQWLASVSAVVLLIACANAANLLLTRGLRRRREIAVRLALGASRTRLVRQLLTESLALAALAGAAALLLAFVIAPLIRSLVLPDDAALGGVIDARVLAFTAAAALLCSVACGIFPAVQSSRPDLNVALKAGADRQSSGRWNTRSALVVGQIALTFVLLIGAGLFVRSFRNVSHINLGMDAERLLVVNVNLGGVGYKPEEAEAFYRRLLERAKTVPGVEHASAVHSVPFQSSWRTRFYVPGRDPEVWGDAGGGRFNHLVNFVTADFFRTTGTAVLRGRSFTKADRAGSLPVAIVNESLARRIWPGEEALGKCVKVLSADAQCAEVVGVAADARMESLFEERSEQYYLPLGQPRRGE